MLLVAVIGAVTALMAGTIGLVQTNIKRVLAYSTVSQLGYMFLAAGVGAFGAAIFHLATHAFFKAALFLAAGGVIHALHGEEDLFKMGGLARRLPLIYGSYLFGALALAGVPLFAGFFSKDEIIQAAFGSHGNPLLGLLALATVVLTGFYVFRSLFLAFHGAEHGEAKTVDVSHLRRERRRQQALRASGSHGHQLHALSPLMTWTTVILGGLSLLGSLLTFGIGGYLEPVFTRYHAAKLEEHSLNWPLIMISTLLGLIGIGLAYLFYIRQPGRPAEWTARYRRLYAFLLNRWYIDQLYDAALVRPTRLIGDFVGRSFDPGFVDGIVMGLSRLTGASASGLRTLQTGYLRNYALAILGGTVLVLLFVLVRGGIR
jgi:NADH-quinone oxidoreductase subunit L